MSVVINTNVDALKIQNILTGATDKLSQSMQRMSSGLKINSAKDDAAGTVISARMNVQLDGNKICQNNVQNANSLLSTAEGNLDVILDNLSRIRDLTLQAKNGTYSDDEIQAMQDEVTQRINEINRVSESSKYSQLQLFGEVDDNGVAKGLNADGAKFQVGANHTDDNTIEAESSIFKSVKFSAMTGVGDTNNVSNFDLKTLKNTGVSANVKKSDGTTEEKTIKLDGALEVLDNAINDITSRKSTIGSVQNRLESALDTLTTQYANLSSAKSIITDADIASEASVYTQQQILQQVSTSLLAQANQSPSIALSLL